MTTGKAGLSAIVLAAGKGTRMKSQLPKVLHPLCGRPLVDYAVTAAFEAGADQVVVVTSGQPEITRALEARYGSERIAVVVQDPPRGTGDAVRVGLAAVKHARTLILYGDTPLLRAQDLSGLLEALAVPGQALALLTALLDAPFGYGRVLRDAQGAVVEVREQRDLQSDAERAIREVNAGMYAAVTEPLRAAVADLKPNNAQGEYYLTDIVAFLAKSSRVAAVRGDADALVGVNDRADLARAEELLFARHRDHHRRAGVTVQGDARIDGDVEIAPDAVIGAGVSLRGRCKIGAGSRVDVGSVLIDAEVGAGAEIKPYCVIVQSSVGDRAQLGPFAHLRPESVIEADAHIGNFVETKKTRVRRGAKANHLAYLGDADIGERANVGAGTIVCNYDGFVKHRTTIGEGAFIGSDSQLIAPVTIGKNAYVATGTTITEDVEAEALAIGRARQVNKPGYATKLRERLAAAKKT
ncbi:MAG TPA: bifunctional UDP-N-acetylglucosamine diphosphorylase/glucosamine-1-phosphate N-acetyltransferase GlmU [Polyangiaceae bacterium]|nr:bifunctional UDP-N-acetylglucosamine diphosphorylase/glucosamine-1-phosphate N-acetyltransferase GlmU [Polyangiaceae bacterium]